MLYDIVNIKLNNSHRMYIFCGEFNYQIKESESLYRNFDT